MAHIIFDIGGTKLRVARVLSETEFSEPVKIETPETYEEGFVVLEEIIRDIASGEDIQSIAGGIAGIIHEKTIINSSNLKGWIGADFARFGELFGADVRVANDASVVGLGEAVFGAGRGHEIVVYLTISTGVGGGRIVSRAIDKSVFGFEPGHHIIDNKNKQTLEELISGKSFERKYGVKPYEVTDPEVWSEAAKNLAVGVHNTTVYWSPNIIVLGGPMMIGSPAISFEETKSQVRELTSIFPEKPLLALAELKDDGGLYGALALLG